MLHRTAMLALAATALVTLSGCGCDQGGYPYVRDGFTGDCTDALCTDYCQSVGYSAGYCEGESCICWGPGDSGTEWDIPEGRTVTVNGTVWSPGALVPISGALVYFGLVAFIASYYERVLGTSPAFGNAALAVMLFAGAVGTLLIGPLADRFGRRTVIVASMLILPPLIFCFTLAGPYAGMALLVLVGATTVGTFGVTVVMGQEYLPGRIGLAAGVTMGLSIGLGGIGAPLLGLLADRGGLETTMLAIAALPVLGLVLSLTLPRKTA